MSDARTVLQHAVRRDRQKRMGLRVGQVMSVSGGAATVNFGRDTDVRVPGTDVGQGGNSLVLELDGTLLPLGSAPVVMGTPNPAVESLP